MNNLFKPFSCKQPWANTIVLLSSANKALYKCNAVTQGVLFTLPFSYFEIRL